MKTERCFCSGESVSRKGRSDVDRLEREKVLGDELMRVQEVILEDGKNYMLVNEYGIALILLV